MTTFRKQWVTALAAAAALAAAGCGTDSLTSINQNPNSPETAPSGAVFTTASRLAVTRWLGSGFSKRATELVAQHLAEVQYPESDTYTRLRGASTSGFFDGAYVSELKDLTSVVNTGLAQNEPGLYGPAIALRTWVFGNLTDTYGDIPYFSALAGDSSTAVFSPTYDPQKDIYADFFLKLAKVSTDLSTAPATGRRLGAADPIYAGNITRWSRFANSLRLRYAMRLSNVDRAKAQAEAAAALAAPGGVLQSNADNAQLVWPGGVNANSNSWAVDAASRDDHRISRTLISLLRDYNDPRVTAFASPVAAPSTGPLATSFTFGGQTYVGFQNGTSQAVAANYVASTSRTSPRFIPNATTYGVTGANGNVTPSYILTFAEVSFLKAEAAERGWISGSARTFYEDGIRASMNQWGITDAAAIATYIASPAVAYQGGNEGLKQIARQKWIALFTDGGEAWAEFRRTCQPSTIRPGPSAIIGTIPRRFQYSVTEAITNNENLQAAISRMGGDEFTTRVYWDTGAQNAGNIPTFETGCGVR